MLLFDSFFLNSANLICRCSDISKYFRESIGIRDNESRLFFFFFVFFFQFFFVMTGHLPGFLKTHKRVNNETLPFHPCKPIHLQTVQIQMRRYVLSGSALFVIVLLILCTKTRICNNGCNQIRRWKSPFYKTRLERVNWSKIVSRAKTASTTSAMSISSVYVYSSEGSLLLEFIDKF